MSNTKAAEYWDKHNAKVREAQELLDERRKNGGGLDENADATFQNHMNKAAEYRRMAKAEEAATTARGYGQDAIQAMRDHAVATEQRAALEMAGNDAAQYPPVIESVFETRSRQGWKDPGDREYEGLEIGKFLKAKLYGSGSLTTPNRDLYTRALSEGTDTAGGNLVPAPLAARIIDALRNELVIRRAGAQVVNMEHDTLKIAKITGDPGFSWVAELSTGATVDPTYGAETLTAHTLRGIVVASRELVDDSSPNLESVLQTQFIASMALEVDRTALVGVGSTGEQPLGLSNTTGIPVVEVGSTTAGGAVLTYTPLLTGLQTLMANNAARVGTRVAAIMSPRSFIELGKLQEASTDQGQSIMVPPALANVDFLVTAAVPETFAWGATTDATEIYMGNFNSMVLGQRDTAGIELLRERYANQFAFGFLGWTRADMALEHDNSFVTLKGIKATT